MVSGPASGARLRLDEEALEIGREAEEKEGRLGDDRELSRRHARISPFEGGRLLVEDLGSTNGTLVNGDQIVGATVLSTGDTIELGGTILRVVPPAAAVYGRVHSLPTNLRSILVARAPVRKEWIIKAALTALPIVIMIDFLIRTVAVEFLGVRSSLPTMHLAILVIICIMPTIGNSVGFYLNFGRPADHSVAHYLVPTFIISLSFAVVETILLPSDASAVEYVVTIVVAVAAPSVVVPTMLALRVRGELAAQRRLGGPGAEAEA